MRPLPDLSPVLPSSSVFTLPADDWTSVFADQTNEFDSLLSLLGAQENTQGSNAAAIGDSIDAMGGGLNDLIGAFNTLSDVMDLFDVAGDVGIAALAFDELANNLNNWSADIPAFFVQSFLGYLLPTVAQMIQVGIQPVYTEIAQVEQNQGGGILGDILSAIGIIIGAIIKGPVGTL